MPKPRMRIADLAWAALAISLIGALCLSESSRARWEYRCLTAETDDEIQALYMSSYLSTIRNRLPAPTSSPGEGCTLTASEVEGLVASRDDMRVLIRLLQILSHHGVEVDSISAKTSQLLLYPGEREKTAKAWLRDGSPD